MNKELICIICPRGCRLHVDDNLNVSGNNCPRGEIYAKSELTNPQRTITTTVKIYSKNEYRLPVKTNKPVPKDKMFEIMKEIEKVSVSAPIKIGDTIIKNILNLNVDIVASKNIEK